MHKTQFKAGYKSLNVIGSSLLLVRLSLNGKDFYLYIIYTCYKLYIYNDY